MIEPVVHETPDGSGFRISRIQALRSDPCFDGVVMTYLVEPEAASTGAGGASARGGDEPGTASAAEEAAAPVAGFRVVVRFAPIFMSILSPEDRTRLEARATALIAGLLDRGVRDDAEVEVTSDGAVRLDGEVVSRQLPLGRGAA